MSNKLEIKYSRETAKDCESVILECFPVSHFKHDKVGSRMGFGGLETVITFSISSIVSGILYDALKVGVLKVVEIYRSKNINMKMTSQDSVYVIKSNSFFVVTKNGKRFFKTVDEMLIYLKNDLAL